MFSFHALALISVICGIMAIIFSILAVIHVIKERLAVSTITSAIAALFSAALSFSSVANITVPTPVILPLDNDTQKYIDKVEVTIKTDPSKYLKTYYTLDGTDPEEGEIYKDVITFSESATVCARNKFLWLWSEIVERPYVIIQSNGEISGKTNNTNLISEQNSESHKADEKDEPDNGQVQEYQDGFIISWEDATFEKLIKECLGKEQITYADVKDITALDIMDEKIVINDSSDYIEFSYYTDGRQTFISLNDLKYFTSLKTLNVYNYTSVNCDIFESEAFIKNLTSLSIMVRMDSEQIKQISNLQNLINLYLYGSTIRTEDLENIAKLNNLKYLGLSRCFITDISPISNLTQLKRLNLSINSITNIDILKNFKDLEYIVLYGNQIDDFSPVSHVNKVIKTYEESGRQES